MNYKKTIVYKFTLGEKHPSPDVKRLSVKRLRYHKRMAMRRDIGNQMLARAEIVVPSVESLMISPLSKYIHFATNDCG